MTRFHEREITSTLLAALADLPVVVLTGMRQVGKSTLLQQQSELKGRRYVSLDDFAQLEAARSNPEAFLRGDAVTIDEVQKCPELLPAIKRLVDQDRRPGRFLLSGSANLLLLKHVTEALAGRAVYFTLYPFTRRETRKSAGDAPFLARFLQAPGLPQRVSPIDSLDPKEVLLGGMPSVCLHHLNHPHIWFKGFEQTYLERDLRDLSQVADLVAFRRLLQLAALRTGQLLRISQLARDAGQNVATVSRYLGLMETGFVIRRVEPYLANRASRMVKSPKLYLTDSGLACHLAGVDNLDPDSDQPLRGAMYENYLAQNLSSILEAHLPQARLSFWSVQGRHEVDFVIELGRETVALEVKAAGRWGKSDLSGLRAFLSATPGCRVAILAYNGTQLVQLGERLWAVPLGLLLS